jgi:iron(III) transport system substrate-binding protein
MVVNTEVVKQIGARPIKTYEDLLQPQLKGLIGISDPRIAAVILQRVTHESEVLGVDYMPKLAALTPRIYEALGAQVQAVASGDLAVGMTVYSAALVEAIKAGAPIEGVYPIPEAYIYFQGIPKTAAHPAAAQVLQDWLLSKAGQQAQHEWGYTGSVLPDIKGAYAVKPGTVMFRGNLTAKDKDFQKTWNQLFAK